MHDDALIVDRDGTIDLEVHQNVITKSLMAISFARTAAPSPGESRSVHRNLIDLREPTASIRPRPDGHLVDGNDDTPVDGVFRYGQLYKSNSPDGPMDFFHNTCLVRRLNGPTGFGLFRGAGPGDKVRRSVNNVFVDVTPSIAAGSEYVTAFLPPPDFRGPTDGNCYVQIGGPPRDLLRHERYDETPGGAFGDLATYRQPAARTSWPARPYTRPASRRTGSPRTHRSAASPPTAPRRTRTTCGSTTPARPGTTASTRTTSGSPTRSRRRGRGTWVATRRARSAG